MRRGGIGSTVAALVLALVLLMILGLALLAMLILGLSQPIMFAMACLPGIPFAMLILLCVWLVGALRATRQTSLAQQQYAAQYWQYQQNAQAHGGYGYAAPQQPLSPLPPPSIPPQSPPPRSEDEHGSSTF